MTLETAGTVFKPLRIDLLSLSPKLSNSTPWQREGGRFARVHDEKRLNFDAMQRLIDAAPDVQLKFVVAAESDLSEVESVLSKLQGWEPADVLLMPEGTDAAALDARSVWLAEACKRTGLPPVPAAARLPLRQHARHITFSRFSAARRRHRLCNRVGHGENPATSTLTRSPANASATTPCGRSRNKLSAFC